VWLERELIANLNAEQHTTVSSGSNSLRPTIIIPPVMRIGATFDW
jgi:hypothetical protein